MLSSHVDSIHSDDLIKVAGAKTFVPQNFTDSEQATHSAIPVFEEDSEAYRIRENAEIATRASQAEFYKDQITSEDGFTEEELANWGKNKASLHCGEIVCNDGIIRPIVSLRDHASRVSINTEPVTVTEIDETGTLSTTVLALPETNEPRYIAGVDPRMIPVGFFPDLKQERNG